jgi:predicted phage terminase large subunit-like protein
VLTEKGEIPIKDVAVGDKVLTRDGWKPVYFSGPTKITKDLCSVVFSDGTWNTSTPDHEYLTSNRNWITIASIRDGDELISTQEQAQWEDPSIQKSKPLCSTEKGTLEPTGVGTTTITQETRKPENSIQKHYIGLSGSIHTTKKYPVAIMYTTLTETGITTAQRTLNACLEGNITNDTSNNWVRFTPEIQQKFQKILKEHMRAYGCGGKDNVQKTRKNTDRKRLSEALPQGTHFRRNIRTEFQGSASYATASTCRKPRAAELNTARKTARNTEHRQKKNDKTGNLPAKCVAWNRKDTVVKDIVLTHANKLAGAVVYDLSVRESPEFFANGVLVHNCTDGGGDYTVGVKMGLHKDGSYWILDVVRGQWASDERERMIHSVAVNDGKLVRIGLEQEPGSSGIDSVKETIRRLSGFLVNAEKATGDKVTRADTFSVQVNIGNVKMVRGGWVSEYKYEVQHFPNGKHDDQVDATSGAFTMLINKKVRLGVLK